MKRNILVIMSISFIILSFIGCEKSQNTVEHSFEFKRIKELPIEMPDDFEIVFLFGYDISYNLSGIITIKGTIQRDLVLDGLAMKDFDMDTNFKMDLYEHLKEVGILNYTSKYKPMHSKEPEETVEIHPSNVNDILIKYVDVDFNLHWNDSNFSDSEDAVELRASFQSIMINITTLNEYISFPDGRGGYD